ncbi:MAG: ABC transporter ATP-binding protein [Gammaproteobacteria bacterium]|nr:ABC transporter ATP-binding protein [Gammaproteobacteria bacterium]
MPALLEVSGISCRYPSERSAVVGASFQLDHGMLACLLGPSGCGKTTVLRAIAGFRRLDTGAIYLNGERIADTRGGLPPERRGLGMVFQEHALFPHLNVEDNITAGLRAHSAAVRRDIARDMLARLGLAGMERRYPHELSGGQQQRVALARALAPRPRLLLMDEPFSSLDFDLREKLRQEVRDLLKDIGAACLLVTHDQQDAFTFGERVGVMRRGAIVQWDTAYRIYHRPATRFVADFIGEGVLLDGVVESGDAVKTELATLRGEIDPQFAPGDTVQVLLRPDDIVHDDAGPRFAKIKKRAFRGENYLYTLALPSGREILSLVPSHHNHAVGEDLGIKLEIDHLVLFSAASQ